MRKAPHLYSLEVFTDLLSPLKQWWRSWSHVRAILTNQYFAVNDPSFVFDCGRKCQESHQITPHCTRPSNSHLLISLNRELIISIFQYNERKVSTSSYQRASRENTHLDSAGRYSDHDRKSKLSVTQADEQVNVHLVQTPTQLASLEKCTVKEISEKLGLSAEDWILIVLPKGSHLKVCECCWKPAHCNTIVNAVLFLTKKSSPSSFVIIEVEPESLPSFPLLIHLSTQNIDFRELEGRSNLTNTHSSHPVSNLDTVIQTFTKRESSNKSTSEGIPRSVRIDNFSVG